MAHPYTNLDNLRFLLHQVHSIEELLQLERFADYDTESIDLLLQAAKDLADREYFPYFREMDEQPARYENGRIITHPKLGSIIRQTAEAGFLGPAFDYRYGGMQLPHLAALAAEHIFESANNHVTGYLGLTAGAARLIFSFGNQPLIDTYVPRMMSGHWMGTMALTEPQAGSSLSDLTTTAFPAKDGNHYQIKGQKIFISGGDHPHAENFVHLVLARIEGAPAGTKGISLFVVPRMRPDADGQLEFNDVITAGDYQKMGQKGYATAHLVFGENDNCCGYLVGEPHRGLKYMFQMMNAARIAVGISATSVATAAYHASLHYAKERPQGRRLLNNGKKDLSGEQSLIINHPDVRRMLLLQKAITEGALSLLAECSRYSDLLHSEEAENREKYHLLLELLTPVAKTYPAEKGREAIDNGLQVLGGYGFCTDFPLQQYYRDIRIMAIYEGTTGIQSIDLLGRKVTLQNGKALQLLMEEIQPTLQAAADLNELRPYAHELQQRLEALQAVLQHLLTYAQRGQFERYLADANLFMEFAGIILVGWQWLKMGVAAKQALLTNANDFSTEFYESKILAMQFYFRYEIPRTLGLETTLLNENLLTLLGEKELIA